MGASARKVWAGFFDPGDTIGSGALSLAVRDALGLGGTAGPASYVDAVSDGLSLLESSGNVITLSPATVSDALGSGDSVASRLSSVAVVTEALTTSETVVALLLLLDSVSDGLSLGDSQSNRVTFVTSVSDALSQGDSQLSRLLGIVPWTESLSPSESLASRLTASATVTDGWATGDATADRLTAVSTTLDGVVISESLSCRLSGVSTTSDGWFVLEVPTFEFTPGAAGYVDGVTDALTMGAGAATVTSLTDGFGDGWALGEVLGSLVVYRETWADDFSLDSTASDTTSPVEPPTITIPSEVIERAMALADKLIKKFGRPVDLVVFLDQPPVDVEKPWRVEGTTAIIQTVKGVFLKVEGNARGEDQKKGKQVLVAALGLSQAPNIKGEIRVDSEVWKITKIQPVRPGGVDILYTLTVTQ